MQLSRQTMGVLFSSAVFCTFAATLRAQTTWYVDGTNCRPNNEQGTELRPFCDIRTGINNANEGDTVLVMDGVYTGVGNSLLAVPDEITLRSQNGPDATIIDCEGSYVGIEFFAPDGTLYATPFDDLCLVILDQGSGAGACVPGTEGNVLNRINALDFCPDTGVLYGSWKNAETDGAYSLVTLDLTTGLPVTSVPTVTGLDAIAFALSCSWDCGDNDGTVGIVDFLALLAQWGQVDTSCDFDGGGLGITDCLELLANWGPCP